MMPSVVKVGIKMAESEEAISTSIDMPSPLQFSAFAMDCWAAGATIYCFMYGVLPFPVDIVETLLDAHDMLMNYCPLYTSHTSDKILYEISDLGRNMKFLVQQLLIKDSERRFSATNALQYAKDRILLPLSAEVDATNH